MIHTTYENNCVGCPMGCINCGKKHELVVDYIACDICGDDADELYDVDGTHMCQSCLESEFKLITFNNAYDFI